ncbi:MAG: hypothetical protein ACKD6N_01310 [Candidatus Bathyarchaeota archaeon]
MESIRKFIKEIQRKKILVCPKCGNSKIYFLSPLDEWITPPQYVCSICRYTGPIVVEIDEEKF